jgi:hypothetical protein
VCEVRAITLGGHLSSCHIPFLKDSFFPSKQQFITAFIMELELINNTRQFIIVLL